MSHESKDDSARRLTSASLGASNAITLISRGFAVRRLKAEARLACRTHACGFTEHNERPSDRRRGDLRTGDQCLASALLEWLIGWQDDGG